MNENNDSVFDPVEGSVSEPSAKSEKKAVWDFSAEFGEKTVWDFSANAGKASEPAVEPAWINHKKPVQASVNTRDVYRATHYSEDLDSDLITAERPSKRKALLIGLGCLLLALLAAGGWWLLNHLRRDPLTELKLAASKCLDAYEDYIQELPNLHQYTENLKAFYGSDSKRVALSITVDGVPQTPDFAFHLQMDRDGNAKKTLLHGSYAAGGMTIPIDLYIDKEELQLASSTLLNAGESLALPTKDFGKKWNASDLAKLTENTLPEDFSLSFLAEGFSEQSIQDTFGTDWTDFVDSISYRKATEADGDSFFTGAGEIYLLSWDQALLEKMGMKAENTMRGFSTSPKMEQYYPALLVGTLYAMSKEVEAPRFLVSDGMLRGISFREKTEQADYGVNVIELVGERNPWSRCVIDVCKWNSETQTLETLRSQTITMTVADGQLRMKAVLTENDSNEESELFEAVYNDADGSYSFSTAVLPLSSSFDNDAITNIPQGMGTDLMKGLNYHGLPTDDGVQIEMDLGLSAFTGASVGGSAKLTVTLGTKTDPVQPLSKEPTQLLELNESSLSILVMRIYSKLIGENR